MKSFLICLPLGAGLLLAGCDGPAARAADEAPPLSLAPWPAGAELAAETLEFLPSADDLRLAAGRDGLAVLDPAGGVRGTMAGRYALLDSRPAAGGFAVATQDVERQQATVVTLAPDAGAWRFGAPVLLPARAFAVEGLCLYRDGGGNLSLFLVGDEGRGEQWLVGGPDDLLPAPRLIRRLSLPPAATACRTDDAGGLLYVNEEDLGLWVQGADGDAAADRRVVDLRQPHGTLAGGVRALAPVPGGLLALDAEAGRLRRYAAGGTLPPIGLAGLKAPDGLAARVGAQGIDILLRDEATGRFHQGRLDWSPAAPAAPPRLPVIAAERQTEPMSRQGDAADDPAIWLNPEAPERSLVLGTNKKQGLVVYDLDGRVVQDLPVGRLNNVDVRAGFALGTALVDIAVASNRDRNTIDVFAIDRASGTLRPAGAIETGLAAIYGICLFQAPDGPLYAFANDKDGSFLQYRLAGDGERVTGTLLRRFEVASQPEGCVADDRHQRLFLGEEDVGVWSVDARPEGAATLAPVAAVGDLLVADVEGLALYPGAGGGYLLVSSQGNDSYAVFDALPPHRPRGAFRIGINAAAGIDGASETDGIEVTAAPLGGVFGQGLLVVQDGRKRMPESSQNFKLVPWSRVAETLALD
ncbi:phytase [Zavarzinia compransoris]|uniref:3-phytase n=1 Tax=Zavarzinia compransoris TaxID=1264899 RepID=A0A317E2S6_9PROT|nr:phytase [Zavarzinia compransoris]PWR20921.1 3-phytase [Zavarzinia compransoris]TDP44241.1 3-phytase [Zavarzinia compransoris]